MTAEYTNWREILRDKTIGVGLTGSFCTMRRVLAKLRELKTLPGVELIPILSENVQNLDSKFGRAVEWREELADMGAAAPLLSIPAAEPIGPTACLDVMLLAPCTGNSMAKLALGITDGPVLMAAKAHLRNQKPLLIALATNDALGANAKNLGALLNVKNVYFVPLGQDDPLKKPASLIFDAEVLLPALAAAACGKQLQPVLREY
ncbi:MAG TPA: dipicolinate synthase subunit B [Candidatus Avidehalobacter gallistercoris]|uniref:Dipicolinate synthase subunit B n=1 Tax=Candidatus Avidehalobacter gallistercoris TaxID=2840694 RepID=A0A9D1HJW2_9FIRM|nr:dipicolinate synthase subunit B [Candidatus Avidehalobacter gallistercoris]